MIDDNARSVASQPGVCHQTDSNRAWSSELEAPERVENDGIEDGQSGSGSDHDTECNFMAEEALEYMEEQAALSRVHKKVMTKDEFYKYMDDILKVSSFSSLICPHAFTQIQRFSFMSEIIFVRSQQWKRRKNKKSSSSLAISDRGTAKDLLRTLQVSALE